MGCTIDHLQSDHQVRVLREFTDLRGTRHRPGDTGIIRRLDLDWTCQEIVIEWEYGGARKSLFFALAAKAGPGNGRMREFFELGERIPLPEDLPAARKKRNRPAVPALAEKPVVDAGRYSDAVRRVWALAARRRFTEAEEQIQLILRAPDPHGGVLEQLAEDLVVIAETHAFEEEYDIFSWARERGTHLWYAWGSQATSGGEGAVRAGPIHAAEERLAQCDPRR